MRTKRVNRYYCEFCRKSGGSAGHMVRHEEHCTMNPHRKCRMCESIDTPQPDIRSLLSALPNAETFEVPAQFGIGKAYRGLDDGIRAGIERCKSITECPICIFAALRQSGLIHFTDTGVFDLKAEMAKTWQAINDADARAEMDSYHY